MDGFSALRACVAQLSEVVDAVERISDTCVMTLATNLTKLPPGYCKISGQQLKVLTNLISEE